MTEKPDPRAKYVKVEVVVPFERYRMGEKTELPPQKAAALEQQGMVKPATKTAEKQIAKANP
jgi:hypothetical protein